MRHNADAGLVRITLLEAPVRPIAVGESFTIRAGCDKMLGTCRAKFANIARFRGFPQIPGNDTMIRYPSSAGDHAGEVL
jgi:uncharacterized phage protein (TIGR02218 family)